MYILSRIIICLYKYVSFCEDVIRVSLQYLFSSLAVIKTVNKKSPDSQTKYEKFMFNCMYLFAFNCMYLFVF